MTAKKFNAKDFFINNGIIVVLILLAVFTAIRQPTFASFDNLKNVALNVAPRFIIACGISGILITNRPIGRTYGWSFCMSGRNPASETRIQRKVFPKPS